MDVTRVLVFDMSKEEFLMVFDEVGGHQM